MTLDVYLLKEMMEEKSIIEELLKIDNSIQQTNFTYSDLIEKIKNSTALKHSQEELSNVILDGEPDTTYTVLLSFAPYIKHLHINRTFVAINKWLVERAKEYYYKNQIDIPISLDIERGYDKYLEDDLSIILYGFPEFVEGIKDIFSNKNLLIINK